MDALMGIVGAVLITRWSMSCRQEGSGVLLELIPGKTLSREIKEAIEGEVDNQIIDLPCLATGPEELWCDHFVGHTRTEDPEHYKKSF